MKLYYWLGGIFLGFVFLFVFLLTIDRIRVHNFNVYSGGYRVGIFSYGWHTGIVIFSEDIPPKHRPRFALFRNMRYIEISWGDEKYFRQRSKQINFYLALRALFWPTSSVIHMVGFNKEPEENYRHSKIRMIYVDKKHFENMLDYVSSFIVGDANHAFSVIEPGLYGRSWFLHSKGKYIIPFTCNVWTARALREAGIPLTPWLYQSAELLMYMLRELGPQKQRVKGAKLALSPAVF